MKTKSEIVESELLKTGWVKSNEKVWTKRNPFNSKQISFPNDAYQNNSYKESFWSKARAELIIDCLNKTRINQLFEVGSGHGNVAIPLSKAGFEVIALEPLINGANQTGQSGITTINGSLSSLEDHSFTFPAIGIFDVLEHIENPVEFLIDLSQKLQPNGVLILTVPAHNWLFSDFDKAIGHHKRYTKKILRNEMLLSGYQEISSRYFFTSLVLPAFFVRRIPYLLGRSRDFASEKGFKQSIDKITKLNKVIDLVFYKLLKIDSKINAPVGLSLLGVYKKR